MEGDEQGRRVVATSFFRQGENKPNLFALWSNNFGNLVGILVAGQLAVDNGFDTVHGCRKKKQSVDGKMKRTSSSIRHKT